MRRLKLYKILIPAALVLFVVVLIYQLEPLGDAHSLGLSDDPQLRSKATGIQFVDMDGGRKTLEGHADEVRKDRIAFVPHGLWVLLQGGQPGGGV